MKKYILANTFIFFLSFLLVNSLCGQTHYLSSGEAVIKLHNEINSVQNSAWDSEVMTQKEYLSYLATLKSKISAGNDVADSIKEALESILEITAGEEDEIHLFVKRKTVFLYKEE